MKKILIFTLLICFAFLNQSFIFESNQHKAIRLFKKDLKYIEACASKKEKKYEKLPAAIANIEKITSIRSEAGFSFFGRYLPTNRDIRRWNDWFEKNQKNLRWDSKKKKVYLYVEKKLPGKFYPI